MNGSPIIVIQCSAHKRSTAGRVRLRSGQEVLFVAKPDKAPKDGPCAYAHPDGPADTCPDEASGYGMSWRQKLDEYNQQFQRTGENPWNLLPASKLYTPREPYSNIYSNLVERYRPENVYILSAGWGLIRADFLTPDYNITFSNDRKVEPYKRRGKQDAYDDWRMLPDDTADEVVFFGDDEDYIKPFCELTGRVKGPRYVFFKDNKPDAPGCHLRKFDTRTRTNWHYECARAFMDGKVGI